MAGARFGAGRHFGDDEGALGHGALPRLVLGRVEDVEAAGDNADRAGLDRTFVGRSIDAASEAGCKLVLEPGRRIVAESGVLLTRVLFVKEGTAKTFVIVDGAMNDLIRPTLYEAYHEILPVAEPKAVTKRFVTDVAGPVCETGDYLALGRDLPVLEAGDLISVMTAGAYGAVLGSEYNSRLLVPEVLVSGDRYCVTRPRPSYDDMLARERVPNWLQP